MSGSLLEIRKKISGIRNTRKITKAMQLVAASKMRAFQKRAVSTRNYVKDLLAVLEKNLDTNLINAYATLREKGTTVFVLYTSDKGLCGPLNNKLINALFRSKRWLELEPHARKLITIGKKSYDYAHSNKIHIEKQFKQIPEKLSNLDALKIVDGLLELWNNEEDPIKEIIFIAPHYKNSFTFYPVVKTFLPFSEATIVSTLGPIHTDTTGKGNDAPSADAPGLEEDTSGMMLFDPNKEQVRSRLYEQLIQALFMQSFMELKASEYSSRMIAMQNATDAADRITNDLTRDYNKARQAVITREIAELMGASDAIGA